MGEKIFFEKRFLLKRRSFLDSPVHVSIVWVSALIRVEIVVSISFCNEFLAFWAPATEGVYTSAPREKSCNPSGILISINRNNSCQRTEEFPAAESSANIGRGSIAPEVSTANRKERKKCKYTNNDCESATSPHVVPSGTIDIICVTLFNIILRFVFINFHCALGCFHQVAVDDPGIMFFNRPQAVPSKIPRIDLIRTIRVVALSVKKALYESKTIVFALSVVVVVVVMVTVTKTAFSFSMSGDKYKTQNDRKKLHL